MDEQAIDKIIKTIGISATAIGIIVVAGLAMTAYRNYFEILKLRLEVTQLQRELGIPENPKI